MEVGLGKTGIGANGLRAFWPVMCHRCKEFERTGMRWNGHGLEREGESDGDRCRIGGFREARRGPCRGFRERR